MTEEAILLDGMEVAKIEWLQWTSVPQREEVIAEIQDGASLKSQYDEVDPY